MTEINELLNVPRTVAAGGESITVVCIRLRQLPRVLQHIAALQLLIDALSGIDELSAASPDQSTEAQNRRLLTLLSTAYEPIINLMAELTGKSKDWLGELDLAEAVDVLAMLIEVNIDFFVKRLGPSLKNATVRFSQVKSLSSGLRQTEEPASIEPAGSTSQPH